ncbi:response regulator transcription factor [Oceanimonas sp. MB9]|uniref:response regulator transcription factor n=1 Tax=Oceanimonas sp. MB9 TaxID=2588453 RepID=UPI0013F5C2AE|nr:response regulator transcription factor [Oceanimonas sp. MB9]NHI01958.1 Transcriptional regulatory protein BaeR [Oceanimonas sp. MB9]
MNILVVEDDADWSQILSDTLEAAGYAVSVCHSLQALWHNLNHVTPHAIVLDARLPDGCGIEALTAIRRRLPFTGIIMLTGMVQRQFRVKGLLDGADCYLTKPVMADEVLANLCAVLRRSSVTPKTENMPALSIGRQCLFVPDGGEIALTPQEFSVLRELIRQPLNPVSKGHLIASLGYSDYEYDGHRLETLMYRLRRKLKRIGSELSIKAVYGKGYHINLPVTLVA